MSRPFLLRVGIRNAYRTIRYEEPPFLAILPGGPFLCAPSSLKQKAKHVLGYSPRYNLPEFFEALKRGDRSHYPYADLPWWGF